jgi:sulfite reductase (NADPH) hemoprotein beta-component
MALQMITANRLTDGAVVFLASQGRWVERFDDGQLANDNAEAAALLQIAEAAVAKAEVVAPYLIEVSDQGGRLLPARYRERIRAEGPSVGGKVDAKVEAR